MNRSNYAAYLRHIFVSGLFDPTTLKVTVRHITVRHLRHVMNIPTMFQSRCDCPLPTYDAFVAKALCDLVNLSLDLLTLETQYLSNVTC